MTAAGGGGSAFFLHHSMVLGVALTAAIAAVLILLTVVHSSGHRLGPRSVSITTGVVTSLLVVAFVVNAAGRYVALS